MQRALSAVAAVAGVGVAATAQSEFFAFEEVGSQAARCVIAGVILGSNIWPYNPGLVPAHIHSRLLIWSSVAAAQKHLERGKDAQPLTQEDRQP